MVEGDLLSSQTQTVIFQVGSEPDILWVRVTLGSGEVTHSHFAVFIFSVVPQ